MIIVVLITSVAMTVNDIRTGLLTTINANISAKIDSHWKQLTMQFRIAEPLIIQLQARVRGNLYRRSVLPNSIRYLQTKISPSHCNRKDIIDSVFACPELRKRVAYKPVDHWYDLVIKDFRLGMLIIKLSSIQSTTYQQVSRSACIHALAPCAQKCNVFAKPLTNAAEAAMLVKIIKTQATVPRNHPDYYLISILIDTQEVVANSLRGLSCLVFTEALPFSFQWKDNRKYNHSNQFSSKLHEFIQR